MYILFGGDDYYPGGGLADYRGKYNTLDEAVTAAKTKEFENTWSAMKLCEWWHVLDCDSWQIVAKSEGSDEMIEEVKQNLATYS